MTYILFVVFRKLFAPEPIVIQELFLIFRFRYFWWESIVTSSFVVLGMSPFPQTYK